METDTLIQPAMMKSLKRKIAVRAVLLPVFIGLFILLPAGTFIFWQVYVYVAVLLGPLILVVSYFLKHDPMFLERRLKTKEREPQQKKIVLITTFIFILGYTIPGFDHRFGWSDIPPGLVVIADLLVLLSYIFIALVFKANSYASRVVEVEENQTVISTGPYSFVRHPMYLGNIIMTMATPVALGSYWGLIPFLSLPVALVLRILNEEKVLREQLPGYNEYCSKVKYRLIPYVW